jgi:hypothetical protein
MAATDTCAMVMPPEVSSTSAGTVNNHVAAVQRKVGARNLVDRPCPAPMPAFPDATTMC